MPKLSKNGTRDFSTVTNKHQQELIVKAAKAIEGFVNVGCVSIGLLQMLAINFSKNIWGEYTGWLRTKTSEIPTEDTVRSVLQQEFYYNFCNYSDTAIFKIITTKQRKQTCLYNNECADEAV